jgi:hypothetical protein
MRGWLVILLCILTVLAVRGLIVFFGLASMSQTENDVYRRFSGGRLEPWLSVDRASALHWMFAWASVAAYQDSDDPKRKPLQVSAECPNPDALLSRNWTLWEELPLLRSRGDEGAAAAEMRGVHLRAEVWSSEKEGKIIAAFGGTAATSLQDWKANLRWLLARSHDQYQVLTDTFVPAFVGAYKKRSNDPGGEWMRTAQVIAAGHSLGGGLAQRFAYSLTSHDGVPAVKEVYAFDPSPVSGKREIPEWKHQAQGLTIYRIYNRGEILASLRSLSMFVESPPESQGQRWIDIRYRYGWSWKTVFLGAIHAHRMYDWACFMKQHLDRKDPAQTTLASQSAGPLD